MRPRSLNLKSPILGALCAPLLLGGSSLLANDASPAAVAAAASATAWKEAPLVEKVRRVTSRFRDINAALADGWVQGTPCVSGPNSGAMGVHFVKPERIGDGVLNAAEPEALIYQPLSGHRFRLVGVEFITLADAWKEKNPEGNPPVLEGHLLNFVGEPNRYGLPAFYEIHVWGWEQNPNGSFADWNSVVSCDKQALD